MVAKRIIACLDVKDGRVVKGRRFQDLRDIGDPVELAIKYTEIGIDELVYLDISATVERRAIFLECVKAVAKVCTIPFTVGGGIRSVRDIERVLVAGADKISINSAALNEPELITLAASQFGSQCVVLAVDTKKHQGRDTVFAKAGAEATQWGTIAWIREAQRRGAGEILLTSIDCDGTRSGFDIDLLCSANTNVSIPVIASGGAGRAADFLTLFQESDVSGALAAGIFHDQAIRVDQLKTYLSQHRIEVRR